MANHENAENGGSGGKHGSPNDDSIARLMRLAGPRPSVPQDVSERVHKAVRKEWRNAVVRRRALRWGVPAALAASIVLAVALNSRGPEIDVVPVATVALVDGSSSTSSSRLAPGDAIYAGDSIATGGRGMALAFDNGLSLRLAAGTAATVDAVDELTVTSGKIYADTGPSAHDDRAVTVRTRVGSATDIGTQFAVSYADGTMSVAVREGTVDVSDQRGSYTAEAGQKLTLQSDDEAAFEEIPAYDSSWDWASALAPSFDIKNRPFFNFLQWVARETGRELVFANDSVRMATMVTRLHGSVSGLTPSEAIEAVLPTTTFEYDVNDRQITIEGFAQ